MKLFTVTNNETGEVKGLDLKATLDLTYFDAIEETIKQAPEEFDADEIAELRATHDIGYYVDFQNSLDQLSQPLDIGRFTITPIN